jgi:hypothetical protein
MPLGQVTHDEDDRVRETHDPHHEDDREVPSRATHVAADALGF